jgi:hypothetical protein
MIGNKNTMKINRASLLDIREEVVLEINAEKTTCIFISQDKRHNINSGNKCFECAVELKYLGRSLTN